MIHVTSANVSSAIFHGFTAGDATPTAVQSLPMVLVPRSLMATLRFNKIVNLWDNGTGNDANTAIDCLMMQTTLPTLR